MTTQGDVARRFWLVRDWLMHALSKSKIMASRQCHRRLWLEIHHPELRIDTLDAEEGLQLGNKVGTIARKLYDPKGNGVLIGAERDGYEVSLARSVAILLSKQPIFEAGLVGGGCLAFVDVMLPATRKGQLAWHLIEVKSSTSVKIHHRDEVAIQAFVANAARVPIASVCVAHINSNFKYRGNGKAMRAYSKRLI